MTMHFTRLPANDNKTQLRGENFAAPRAKVIGRCTGLGTAEIANTAVFPNLLIHATALLYAFSLILENRFSETFRLPYPIMKVSACHIVAPNAAAAPTQMGANTPHLSANTVGRVNITNK